jgi:hypothetical protein
LAIFKAPIFINPDAAWPYGNDIPEGHLEHRQTRWLAIFDDLA